MRKAPFSPFYGEKGTIDGAAISLSLAQQRPCAVAHQADVVGDRMNW